MLVHCCVSASFSHQKIMLGGMVLVILMGYRSRPETPGVRASSGIEKLPQTMSILPDARDSPFCHRNALAGSHTSKASARVSHRHIICS